MPVRQSARSEEGSMGGGPYGGKNEGLSLAQAGTGRPDRVLGMDRRQSPTPHQVHCAARRQTGARGAEGVGRRYFALLSEEPFALDVPFVDPSSRSSAAFFAFRRMCE